MYVTIPPPDHSVVLDHGFTLRNVRAELIRTVKLLNMSDSDLPLVETVSQDDSDDGSDATSSSGGIPPSAEFLAAATAAARKGSSSYAVSSSDVPESVVGWESPYESVIVRSGSSCRFHSSRAIKLRLILHSNPRNASPNGYAPQLPEAEYGYTENDSQCASISQTTLLHSVEFRIQVRVTFLHVSTRSEQTYPLIIPIVILPPPAPLPEVDSSIDSAYRKKHDRPPLKTVRREDTDVYSGVVDYEANHAGPSVSASGAPPPFEEAPPPFFSIGEASTSSHPPSFFESESEIIVPSEDHPATAGSLPPPPSVEGGIVGEGVVFGFSPSEQYDGYSTEIARASSPPPSLEMARDDTDVTDLADLVNQPERAMDALNMVLEQQEAGSSGSGLLPPPPPPMDDPSDPPPSIDTDFRSHSLDPPPSILSTDFRSPAMISVLSSLPNGQTAPQSIESVTTLNMSRTHADGDEPPAISPSHAPPGKHF